MYTFYSYPKLCKTVPRFNMRDINLNKKELIKGSWSGCLIWGPLIVSMNIDGERITILFSLTLTEFSFSFNNECKPKKKVI